MSRLLQMPRPRTISDDKYAEVLSWYRGEATPVTGWAETGNDKFAGGGVHAERPARASKACPRQHRERSDNPARQQSILSDALRIAFVAGAMILLWAWGVEAWDFEMREWMR